MFDHLAWSRESDELYLLDLDDEDELDDEEFWTDTDERYEAHTDDADPRSDGAVPSPRPPSLNRPSSGPPHEMKPRFHHLPVW